MFFCGEPLNELDSEMYSKKFYENFESVSAGKYEYCKMAV